jgi:hypothetical protein
MTDEGSWYNGYSKKERDANFEEMKRLIAAGDLPAASGPCALCGDPEAAVEYHNEDYGINPFLRTEPALLALCRHCHRDKIHKRFERHPSAWRTFIAHVRRGGYARDLKDPSVKKELSVYRAAITRGKLSVLRELRPYTRVVGEEWFANLRMDKESKQDSAARPRPSVA